MLDWRKETKRKQEREGVRGRQRREEMEREGDKYLY